MHFSPSLPAWRAHALGLLIARHPVLADKPATTRSPRSDALHREFVSPPDSARPWVYYFIMDGNLTREGITADVRLHGRDQGVVWTAPWQEDVTDALQPGRNPHEIAVANLWPDRLIGDASLPPAPRVTWTTGNPFHPDSPLLESGLPGPVTLQTMRLAE